MKKKLLKTLIMSIFISLLIPCVAHAADIYLIHNQTYNLADAPNGDIIHVQMGTTVTLTGTAGMGTTIVCEGATINLDNVTSIQTHNDSTCPLFFSTGANTLNLIGTSELKAGADVPAIYLDGSVNLTIKSGSNGTLEADGGLGGIISVQNQQFQKLTIESGTVRAKTTNNGSMCAAIGAGMGANSGEIVITGGAVEASSIAGAGIGGSIGMMSTVIRISGGSVTATSSDGAGIGGGLNGYGGEIYITGGEVYASSMQGQDIGNGRGFGGGDAQVHSLDSASVFIEHEAAGSAPIMVPEPSYHIFNALSKVPSHYSVSDTWTFPIGMYGNIVPDPTPTPTPEATPTPSAGTTPSPNVSAGGDPSMKVENPKTGERVNNNWWVLILLVLILLYSKKKYRLKR